MTITEYDQFLALGGFALVVVFLIGAGFGWFLRVLKVEGDEKIEEAIERGDLHPPSAWNCRCAWVPVTDDRLRGVRGAELERGTKQSQPERPFLRGLQADRVIVDDPLCPDHIEVSDQVLVDRDELVALCDSAFRYESGDAAVRARQMLEKIGGAADDTNGRSAELPARRFILDTLEHLLQEAEEPPEPNCSCHVSPPCGDCVNYGHLREAIADAEEILRLEGRL